MIQANEKQEQAISAAGSVVVRAGAGTGKTQMLAGRFVHEVLEHNLSPLEVVAVTFTEKAAAELRARVRSMMLAKASPSLAAEADAAMIGTIHSLAAHICREFGEVIGIPPDFAILDEGDAGILLAGSIDEAMFRIDPNIVNEIGYTRLRNFLGFLAADPIASETAFTFGEDHYRKILKEERQKAFNNLRNSDAWTEARDQLGRYSGANGDKLEEYRQSAVTMIDEAEERGGLNLDRARTIIKGFRKNLGAKGNWDPDEKEKVAQLLAGLKTELTKAIPILELEFGPADLQMLEEANLLQAAFETFQSYHWQKKLQIGVLDFSDLERKALELLQRAEVRNHYAERWKAILVDEYQDTNPVQEQILDLLAGDTARRTIVGDEKQSIYAFRGADPRVFSRAVEKIDNIVSLDVSFRTHADLVEQTNRIFRPILDEISQDLNAHRETGNLTGPFVVTLFPPEESDNNVDWKRAEAAHIAAEIVRLLNQRVEVFDPATKLCRPAEPRDIAILSRKWAPLGMIANEIRARGIPAVSTGGDSLLETREAIDAMCVLEFAIDPANDIALAAILRSPMFAISDRRLYEFALNLPEGATWWENLAAAGDEFAAAHQILLAITPESGTALSPAEILHLIDQRTGYSAVIANLDDGDRRLADWRAMYSLLETLAMIGLTDTVGVVRYLRRLVEAEAKIKRPLVEAGNAVQLMTIHAAKGLEWPIVFVSGIGLDQKPDNEPIKINPDTGIGFKVIVKNPDGSLEEATPAILEILRIRQKRSNMAETSRLLYVAATRARDRLFFTTPKAKGDVFEVLNRGLERASLEARGISDVMPQRTKWQRLAETVPAIPAIQIAPLPHTLPVLPVTALTDFAICPRRFRYRVRDGHPGITEGPGGKMAFGKLVHLALEKGCRSAEELSRFAPYGLPDELDEAIRIAANFLSAECYADFRRKTNRPEVEISMPFAGILLKGRADLVGDDFVLDFKTGEGRDAAMYRFQLWAYAKYFEKPRAVIAFLNHCEAEIFEAAELKSIEAEAADLIGAISRGDYEPRPEVAKCRSCFYRQICNASAA